MKTIGKKLQGVGFLGMLIFGSALNGKNWILPLVLVILSFLVFWIGNRI